MEHKIDKHQILKVFSKISKHGHVKSNGHVLDGIYAESDWDGYNLFLSNQNVTIRVQFHNTCKVEFKHKFHFEEFLETINKIDKTDYT